MFLVWWFLISMVLYSWAGEKMPWLSIHILLPLMLLAALMIERVIEACVDLSWNVREQGLRALALRPAGQVQLASEASESETSGAAQVKMFSESTEDSEVSAVREPVARDPWKPPAFFARLSSAAIGRLRGARWVR